MNKANAAALAAVAMIVGACSQAAAHHSFAMFASESTEVTGKVLEFKFTNPHTFILLEVTDAAGATTVWNLEGSSPSGLSRRGWRTGTLQPGDEIVVEINPLRSGAPGGSWETGTVKYSDGKPVVAQ